MTNTPPQAQTPQDYVEQKAAASGSSFYYAFLFLPKDKRAAITAFYAFCREVDDIVDDAKDLNVAAAKLAWWHKEIKETYQGKPTHPATKALQPYTEKYKIKAEHLSDIVRGCEMDLTQTRYLDYPALEKYCHLVAGIVGEVSANIFGQTSEQTTQYAHKLGQAFQLTNIIRDVGEDARRGRIYLPLNDCQKFDVKAHEILNAQYTPQFKELMQYQAKRAFDLYEEALALLPAQDFRSQKAGLMMCSIYKTLLKEIQAENFQVLHQRISLTPLRKLWLAWKMQALNKF